MSLGHEHHPLHPEVVVHRMQGTPQDLHDAAERVSTRVADSSRFKQGGDIFEVLYAELKGPKNV